MKGKTWTVVVIALLGWCLVMAIVGQARAAGQSKTSTSPVWPKGNPQYYSVQKDAGKSYLCFRWGKPGAKKLWIACALYVKPKVANPA